MGSSSSHLGSRRPSRPRVNRSRRILASFICGGSSSRAHWEMEDHSEDVLVNSLEHCDLTIVESESPTKDSFIFSCTETGFTSTNTESGSSSVSRISVGEDASFEDGSRVAETSNQGNYLSESNNLVHSYQVSAAYCSNESYPERKSARASSLARERQTSSPTNVLAHLGAVNDIDNSVERGASQVSLDVLHQSSTSSGELEIPQSNGVSVGNNVRSSNYGPLLSVSDSPLNVDSLGNESLHESMSSGLGFLVSDRERGERDGSVLHVDVVSVSSNISPTSNADISNREARRNSTGLFWDAFSRRNSRRHIDSPTLVFSNDDTDDLGSHGRWLLDFSGDFIDDGAGGDSGYLDSRIRSMNEQRHHSRSEIWERIRSGIDDNGQRTTLCSSGVHPDGTCSCDSFLMTEESSTRASISRIVLLTEALFEVLDEIHRQPLSLSLSMVSLPAPESVVDSFPVKNHKRPETAGCRDDVQQCYICLAEYEEGDKIRVLPCHHEYHMSCVDKWLKEIHGVCPLCRGDVCEGVSECPFSNSENLSL